MKKLLQMFKLHIHLNDKRMSNSTMFISLFGSFLLSFIFSNIRPVSAGGIDCFKCVSINGSNPSCEDPFHNNYTVDILERPCMGGRKGRNGLFPASSCTKVAGSYSDGSGTIMIRGCSLDSGTLTTDTELIRMSHCGSFYFNEKYVHGCVQSCDDVDACNTAKKVTSTVVSVGSIVLLFHFLVISSIYDSSFNHLEIKTHF